MTLHLTFHLTPEMMEQSYCLLLTCLPFRRLRPRLPHPDNVEFNVTLHRDRYAHHRAYLDGVQHEISISAHFVKSLHMLNETMAHEMIHIWQDQSGMPNDHGPSFIRMKKLVCRRNSFDLATF